METRFAGLLLLPLFTACSTVPNEQRADANCSSVPPVYAPVATTFEESCRSGQEIVSLPIGRSPTVKFNFPSPQEVTISTASGARSEGGNGRGAQVCIWQSWAPAQPCGSSTVSADNFNAWDGKAVCAVKVPAGVHHVRALHVNRNADEINTSLKVTCR